MAAAVDVANSALLKIKAQRITSLAEGSTNANACNDCYERLRDTLLSSHTWNFAETRAELARSSTAPVFGWTHAYVKPTGWLRTAAVYDNDAGVGTVPYKDEDGEILCSSENVYMRYVRIVTDVNAMPPLFRESLAYSMAVELAIDLQNSRALSERMEARFKSIVSKAKTMDAQGDYPQRLDEGSWVTSRG
jgi:hypothetical protein